MAPTERTGSGTARWRGGDLVIAGIGVTPRTDLAGAAGLRVDDGIPVDQHLATDVPGVYAAGDVACSVERRAGDATG